MYRRAISIRFRETEKSFAIVTEVFDRFEKLFKVVCNAFNIARDRGCSFARRKILISQLTPLSYHELYASVRALKHWNNTRLGDSLFSTRIIRPCITLTVKVTSTKYICLVDWSFYPKTISLCLSSISRVCWSWLQMLLSRRAALLVTLSHEVIGYESWVPN